MSSAHSIAGITDLFNDFSLSKLAKVTLDLTIMGAIGCAIGHAFMQPMGLYDISASLGDSLTEGRNWLVDYFTDGAVQLEHGGGEILSNINPEGFEECVMNGGDVHPHGDDIFACI